VAEVAARHGHPLGLELGHGRGHDRGVDVIEGVAAQAEQVAQGRPQLVGRRLANGGKPPVLDELVLAKRSEVGLRVADVNRKQHGRSLCSALR
jgi:hypothetical protein